MSLLLNETKYMKMSMKNVFEHDTLTSYIYTSLNCVCLRKRLLIKYKNANK